MLPEPSFAARVFTLAGARLGFAIGSKALIQDLNTIRYSTNPYAVNRMTMAAGQGALIDCEYFDNCVKTIKDNREYTVNELRKLGFVLTDSSANFVLAKTDKIAGKDLYLKLKDMGILVRHFDTNRLRDYIRVTVGTRQEMSAFINAVKEII